MTLELALQKIDTHFATAPTQLIAHLDAVAVLLAMAATSDVWREVLRRYLARPDALTRPHYPVLSLPIRQTAHYTLVANVWFPHPEGRTDVTTKAIHHHGPMLLSTVTAFGPGYEHWVFGRPIMADPHEVRWALPLWIRGRHAPGHVAFVDAGCPHVPWFPSSLSITYALWSTSRPTGWRDRVKRWPLFRGREAGLRRTLLRLGLRGPLDLKEARDYDFVPHPHGGFQSVRERREFPLGPVEYYQRGLVRLAVDTGHADLLPSVLVQRHGLEVPLSYCWSHAQYTMPEGNFTRTVIERAMR